MKEKKRDQATRCPGCGRHCPLSAPRCKYGCKYAQKCAAACPCPKDKRNSKEKHSRKWKDLVEKGSLLHLLLTTTKGIKKGLRKGRITEVKLLSVLTPSEKESLAAILKKLETVVESSAQQ